MVDLVKHDLEFILRQIKIAEAHAAGGDLATLVAAEGAVAGAAGTAPAAASLLPYGLRTVDGSYNNLVPGREKWGASDQPFKELLTPTYLNEADGDKLDFGSHDLNGDGVADTPPIWYTNNDYGVKGAGTHVIDADPRIISNLIVDQTLANPAALAAMSEDAFTFDHDGKAGTPDLVFMPNVAPDEGLSSPYSGWMTIFGQFFDHGLDLVSKGGNGTVYVPLQPDDPLYVEGGKTNFMVLTRVSKDPVNLTTSWVDQNQTYGSTASKQIFMREYVTHEGKPIATGHLLEGANGGLATWADIKKQAAEKLGIKLTDADVGSIPLVASDAYGNFIPGANGYAQLVTGLGADGELGTADDVLAEGDPDAPISTAGAIRTAHAFLDDIAHAAGPVYSGGVLMQDDDAALGYSGGMVPQLGPDRQPVLDADGNVVMVRSYVNGRGAQTFYDNEMLDRHFITGDGRGNENIALTAAHHVFHSEHNLLVEKTKKVALESDDLAFLNEWLLVDVVAMPTTAEEKAALVWDGERLFQAARFTNEMEYQHLAFEEFARKMQPDIDAFVFNPSMDIDPTIVAEFAHVVYRFGHSMLNEDIAILEMINGKPVSNDMTLLDGFLNPTAFDALGSSDEAAGAIIRGMTRQVGNEIDEFVTPALRDNLLGLPLDLATINIARGRDVGMPSLNAAREKFYDETLDTQLKPYDNWVDFAENLKNPASIINFIAAYGAHESIAAETTVLGKRAAATALVMGQTQTIADDPTTEADEYRVFEAPGDRVDFLNATGDWAGGSLGGLNDIDFWIGGLAEKKMAFGGMLGSTFSFVFEMTLQNLQDGDRFYYLSRTQGLNLLNELENNSLSKMIMRNTDLGEPGATVLPGDSFSAVSIILEMDRSKQVDADPVSDSVLGSISKMVERVDNDLPTDVTATGVPQGMSFNAATLSLTGSAASAAVGTHTVTITATYASGVTRTHEVEIVVSAPTAPTYPAVQPIELTQWHINGLVDDDYYLATYTDVAAAGMDADVHWENYGAAEGWRNPNEFFSNSYYLQNNPDVAASGVDPLQHYATIGWQQGRDPSAGFDVQKYLDANPDVADAGMDPLYHYLAYGRGEGRAIYAVVPETLGQVNAGAGDLVLRLQTGQALNLKLPANHFRGDGIAESMRINSNDHVVIGGTEKADRIIAGGGDDSIWGRGGDDHIEAGYGVDRVHGDDGDDVIVNAGTDIGETDFLHGGEGNDVIHGGSGLALVFGNQGKDFLIAGPDGKEMFGGTGDDFMLGGEGGDFLLGNEGSDWIEAGNGFDTTAGDNSELFFNSTILGHDVMFAGQNEHDFDAESGDDIMVQGESVMRNEGMYGYDWAIHKGNTEAADSDLQVKIFTTEQGNVLRDRFDQVEALSGWNKNDVLRGDNRTNVPDGEADPEDSPSADLPETRLDNNELSHAGLNRIDGLRTLLGDWVSAAPTGPGVDLEKAVAFDAGNILLGGGGSDVIEGRGGNDLIDGDSWLNVRIAIKNSSGQEFATAEGMTAKVLDLNGAVMFGGKSLGALMLDRTLNPGQLSIVREILKDDGVGDTDIAVFWDVRANYTFTRAADGSIIAAHTGFEEENRPDGVALVSDGVDKLRNIEKVRFADGNGGTVDIPIDQLFNIAATGAPTISDTTPTEGRAVSVSLLGVSDENGMPTAFTVQWQSSTNGTTWANIAGATGASYTPNQARVGQQVRAVVSFTDLAGNAEQVISAATQPVGDLITGTNAGQTLNGTAWSDEILGLGGNDTLNGNAGDDLLNGGTGNDRMTGGTGDDNYVVDASGDVVVESANQGIDTVQTSVAIYTLANNVENLVYTGSSATILTGNTLNNVITGGGGNNRLNGAAGDDILNGLGGNDVLDGGAGADTMIGGVGNDVYLVDNAGDVVVELANQGTDLVEASVSYTLGDGLENLTLTGSAAINGTGNAAANRIVTNTGRNELTGEGGNDVFVFEGGTGLFSTSAITTGATAATRDRIVDFVKGTDKIDLSAIDAGRTGGFDNLDNDAFQSISSGTTFGANTARQLRYHHDTVNNLTIIQGNTDNDTAAEFQIELVGIHNLGASDFIF